MKKLIPLILLAITVLTVVMFWMKTNEQQETSSEQKEATATQEEIKEAPQIGFKAPAFSLSGLDNMTYSLKQTKGKPTVLMFWASWCQYCAAEAPELVELYDQYKDKLEIYAINLTSQDSFDRANAFVEKHNFTFPVPLDEEGTVAKAYRVLATPTIYFINKEGIITDMAQGSISPEQFQKLMKEE
jgi:cytochrome c biogenesis protein CcmG, thiol:disulfide interchange protein DsbE